MARTPRTYSLEERAYLEYVGTFLRQARHGAHLSQEEVAARAGLSRSHISKIEAAEYDPQLSTLLRIATALNIDLQTVLLPYPLPSTVT